MTAIELDQTQKQEGHKLVQDAILNVGRYMAAAIAYANRKADLPDEEFWRRLFIPTDPNGQRSILDERDGNPEKCPPDPYGKLDLQACNKYLIFGENRVISAPGKPEEKAKDSRNFFKTFDIPHWSPNANGQGDRSYQTTLFEAMRLRNKYAHANTNSVSAVTADGVKKDLGTLKTLTERIGRKMNCLDGKLEPLDIYWKRIDQKYNELFKNPPVDLMEVTQELFGETHPNREQWDAVNNALKWFNLERQYGKIYGIEKRALMAKLSSAPSMVELLGPKKKARPAVNQVEKIRPTAVWRPLNAAAATLLKRAGEMIPLRENYLDALLDSFVPLVDESVFLSGEGREFLMGALTSRLMLRHERLLVDESVVATLFRKFRGSAAYTEMEMAELAPEERELLRTLREGQHKNSKTAIKALCFLRKHKCLEVVSSSTDSEYSYDNIRHVAETNPTRRFLVLTMDRQLAEELRELPGRNAAVAKPNLDGQLLLFRATRPAYLSMLEQTSLEKMPVVTETARPAAEKARPAAAESRWLPVRHLPEAGSRTVARWPDGTERELTLSRSIGKGGEGTIYGTSLPDTVAKVYFARQLTKERRDKLQAMLELKPRIDGLCWPQAMLYTADGGWVGYLMPRAQGKELARTVFHPGRNNAALTAQGWTRRSLALIAANIAAVFARMHRGNILMGDINPRNFLVTQDCAVFLVDCDSYQFGDFRCPVGTPLYTPPEVHKQMRMAGREDYGYLRTVENERYSLAVLLFEILMLGKPPYESRNTNNEDVIQAIISGSFPYPYRSDNDGEESVCNGLQAPVGRWRQIWSHMTYRVKTDFYNTFTGKGRLSAEAWEQSMREYARQIESGRSSDELMPNGYKVVTGREGDDATVMVNLVCQQCGRPFNMGQDVYQRRLAHNEPILCNTHWEMVENYKTRPKRVTCAICGQAYETTVAKWIERTNSGKPMVCPNCVNVDVTCSQCGRTYQESRERAERLREKGTALLCPDCFDLVFSRVACQECGTEFPIHRDVLRRRQQYDNPILCTKCRRRAGGQ